MLDLPRPAVHSKVIEAWTGFGPAKSAAVPRWRTCRCKKHSDPQRRDKPFRLTDRETEILKAIVEGRTNPEIAKQLLISKQTVKHHVKNLFNKTGGVESSGTGAFCDREEACRKRLLDSRGFRPTST